MVSDSNNNSYHHGNLREALLHAALDVIRTTGVDSLSLRALARSLGVSQTAPYRHFADKSALLAELATQAFYELTAATSAVIQSKNSPVTNLQNCGMAYLRYATDNPEKYKLMFGPAIQPRDNFPQLTSAAHQAFTVLVDLIEDGIQQGVFKQHPAALMALSCWSGIHGFSMLTIDKLITRIELPVPLTELELLQNQMQMCLSSVVKN